MTGPFPRLSERREPSAVPAAGVLLPPVADFSSVAAGANTRQFTDLSVDLDGEIVDWQWDFGDAPAAPTARFSHAVDNRQAMFTDESFDEPPGTIASWAWTFGDNTTSTAQHPVHLYVADGDYNVTLVVTDDTGLASQPFQLLVRVGAVTLGREFGCYALMESATSRKANTAAFSMATGAATPGNILTLLTTVRTLGIALNPNLTGGSHSLYLKNGKFDLGPNWPASVAGSLWANRMDEYDTPTIKAALRTAHADGFLPGCFMMDEPNHSSWGGVVTKQVMSKMAQYFHSILPSVPCGYSGRYDWDPANTLTDVDYQNIQYSYRKPDDEPGDTPGDIDTFLARALAHASTNNLVIVFSLNLLGGGFRCLGGGCTPGGSPYYGCPIPLTGGKGSGGDGNNCRMTTGQIVDYANVLVPAGAGFTFWQYDSTMFATPAYQAAFDTVRSLSDSLARRRWTNRGLPT